MKAIDVCDMRKVEAGKFEISYQKNSGSSNRVIQWLGTIQNKVSLGGAFEKLINVGVFTLNFSNSGESVFSVPFAALIGVKLSGPVGAFINLGYTNTESPKA